MSASTATTIICPRCEGYIPSNATPGAYPGAISRADNETEICSECGTEEALVALVAPDAWPLSQWENDKFISAEARQYDRLKIEQDVRNRKR